MTKDTMGGPGLSMGNKGQGGAEHQDNGLRAQGGTKAGQRITANKVKGVGHCRTLQGPRGRQGRENILGNIHVRGKRGGEANWPIREVELGYI